MSALPVILVRLRGAAERAKRGDVGFGLGAAADELDAAVADFDPNVDMVSGLRRMVSALARAWKLYGNETGKDLIDMTPMMETEPPRAA